MLSTVGGRKINIVFATHKPTHTKMPEILDLLNNRFIGQVSDAAMSHRASGISGLQANLLSGQGDFYHVGMGHPQRFQVAMTTRDDLDLLERSEISIPDVDEFSSGGEKNVGGRPSLQIDDPRIMGVYLRYGPAKVSRRMAKKLGITRTTHQLYKEFATTTIEEIYKLRGKSLNELA